MLSEKRKNELLESFHEVQGTLSIWLPSFIEIVDELVSVTNNLPKDFNESRVFRPESEEEHLFVESLLSKDETYQEFIKQLNRIDEQF